jgi:hypothetical protein
MLERGETKKDGHVDTMLGRVRREQCQTRERWKRYGMQKSGVRGVQSLDDPSVCTRRACMICAVRQQ